MTTLSSARLDFLLAALKESGLNGALPLLKGTVAWFSHIYAEGSEEALAIVEGWMADNLSEKAIESIECRYSDHTMVAECNDIMNDDIDPLETEQRLELWCMGSEQDQYDESLEQWRNEY